MFGSVTSLRKEEAAAVAAGAQQQEQPAHGELFVSLIDIVTNAMSVPCLYFFLVIWFLFVIALFYFLLSVIYLCSFSVAVVSFVFFFCAQISTLQCRVSRQLSPVNLIQPPRCVHVAHGPLFDIAALTGLGQVNTLLVN